MKCANTSKSTANNDNSRGFLVASDTKLNPQSTMTDIKNDCYEMAHKHALCIEFVLSETEREGFHTGQLLHYRLAQNSTDEKDAPPEKLTLAFATADVVIVGWKLSTLANHLRDGDLLWVRSLPARYAGLDRSKTFVASISITPISKG